MLQDNRKDLEGERQRKLLLGLVNKLSASQPDLYYRSTADIARQLIDMAQTGGGLSADDRALLARLPQRDIEIMLSMH